MESAEVTLSEIRKDLPKKKYMPKQEPHQIIKYSRNKIMVLIFLLFLFLKLIAYN